MVGLETLMLERKEIDKIHRETEEKLEYSDHSNISFDELVRRSGHTYMTMTELAEICKEERFIALASRDDELNTRNAVELCKCVSQNNTDNILYFSLKTSAEEYKNKYPELKVTVDGTAAISIETLERKLESRYRSSEVSMIVIDYLPLMKSYSCKETRREENEQLLLKLKQISEQKRISVLVLLPLSKYASIYSMQKELEMNYGDYISCVDFTVLVTPEVFDCKNRTYYACIGGCKNNG